MRARRPERAEWRNMDHYPDVRPREHVDVYTRTYNDVYPQEYRDFPPHVQQRQSTRYWEGPHRFLIIFIYDRIYMYIKNVFEHFIYMLQYAGMINLITSQIDKFLISLLYFNI